MKYTDADFYIQQTHNTDGKTRRGYGDLYDKLLDYCNPKTILEIGIGRCNSHLTWATAVPDAKVIGLDIAGPTEYICMKNDLQIGQFQNAKRGMDNLCHWPISAIKNIDLYWGRDGYSKEISQEIVDNYGNIDLIINDGKQTSSIHNLFLDAWDDQLEAGAILVQEKLGREQNTIFNTQSAIKAIQRGWLLYDISDSCTFQNYSAHKCIGFNSNRQDQIQELFKDFKRITMSDLT
jgi:hypothetical protein